MSTVEQGRRGEDRVALLLGRSGYTIVERNYRCKLGEIDLIATDGDTLVFVEVRTRTSGDRGSALETVRAAKQRRIARAAEHYLAFRRPNYQQCRFDVVGITADDVVIVKDAFRLGL